MSSIFSLHIYFKTLRFSKVTSERRVRESELHETSTESKTLRQQITTLKEIRDQTIAENGRLSNELADAKADHSLTKKKLKESEKEVDRLKQQLQSYVQKVQRAEDLLMQKEREREEMLDHYRTLSHDAIALEGNNQSLEMETAEYKRQLLEAEQEIARLKQEISIKDRTIEKLEKQVSCLSAQICRLEKDLEQAYDDQKLLKTDLDAIKELCEKLDLQSEKQNAELQERGEIISKLEKENLELRNSSSLSPKDKAATEILQDLLAKSRQELDEERRALCKLAQEKLNLRETIEEMQKNLETEREKAIQKEALAKEYSVQIQEMQHNLTDDRFQKARSREQSPRNHESQECKETETNRLRSGCCNCSCSLNEPKNYSREAGPDRFCCTCTGNCQNYRNVSPSSETSACRCRNTGCKCSQSKSKTKSNSKSKSNSLKRMKSILNDVPPCKRKNLLGDVNNFLGRKSCKFEETVSFDEDSDDIIVCRKRFVETKRFKGYKGDETSLEAFDSIKSSSSKEGRKIDSPKSGSVSDIDKSRKSMDFMYSCQCTSDSEIKEPSYTPGISVELRPKRSSSSKQQTPLILPTTDSMSNITMFSKDPEVESFCRSLCSKTTDSKPSVRYSKDSEIDSLCRKLCDMLPPSKEKMRIKPYVKRNSKCACESLKFNPYWTEAKAMQKRISSASKPRPSKVEAKTGTRDKDSKSKEEIDKCIRSCNVKFGSKNLKSARSNKISSSIKDLDAKDKEIEKCVEECKVKHNSKSSKSSASKERSPIPKNSDTKGQKEMEKCMEQCKLRFSPSSSKSSASKNKSAITKDSGTKVKKEMEKCIVECKLKLNSNDPKPSTSKEISPVPKNSDTKVKKEMEKCIEECKSKFSSSGSKSTASRESSPIPKDSDTKVKEMEKCIEKCKLKLSSNDPKPSKEKSPLSKDSDKKAEKEIEKCVEECKLKFSSNDSKSSALKESSQIPKDSDTKATKEMEKCIEECKLKLSSNDSKPSTSEERSPIAKDSNTKGESEIEKCIEECKSKFSSNDSKSSVSIGRPSTSSRLIKSTKYMSEKDMIKKYKEAMKKCMQECQLKYGLRDSKNESKIEKSSTSSTSSKVKADADAKDMQEELSLQEESSKTIESYEDKSTDDSNMKDNNQLEECIQECRLKLGSKEIAVEGSTSTKDVTSEDTNVNDAKDKEKCIQECKSRFGFKDVEKESMEGSKEMAKLPSPLKKHESKDDTSTEELIMKYKKEIENCIRECKIKFGSNNLNKSSPPSRSLKDEDTKVLKKESTQQKRSSIPVKTGKSIEDSGDTSEDVKTKKKEAVQKCIQECQSRFGVKGKSASKSSVNKIDSSEDSNQMKRSPAMRERFANSSKTRKIKEDPNIKDSMKYKKQLDKCVQECKLKLSSNDSKYASKIDMKKDSNLPNTIKRSSISSSSSKITSDSKDSKVMPFQKKLSSSSKSSKIVEDTSSDDFMKCKEEVEKCIRECKLKHGSRNLKEASKTEDKKNTKRSALKKTSSSSSRSRETDMKDMEKAFEKRFSISSKTRKSKEVTDTGEKRIMEKCIRECKLKFDIKDSKKASSTDSRSLTFIKSSSTLPRSKNSSDEKDAKNKELEECKRECKLKFATLLEDKLEKDKLVSKAKEEKSDTKMQKKVKEDEQVEKIKKEEAGTKSIENKEEEGKPIEKPEIEESKLTRLSSDFLEEYFDAQDLDEEPEALASTAKKPTKSIKDIIKESIGTTSSNVCGQETIDLLANFCASLKKAFEKDKDCPQVVALKPKIDNFCSDVSAKGVPAASTKSDPSVIELKENVDQITIEDTMKEPPGLTKSADNSMQCGRETTALVMDFCADIKKETEKEQECPAVAALKPKIDQLCTDVIPKGKQEEKDQSLRGDVEKAPSDILKNANDSNMCGKETTALVNEFCANIKRTIEKEKDCPAVIALKGKIDQFCIDVIATDKLVLKTSVNNAPKLEESRKDPPDEIKKADDSNVCGKETTTLVADFCRIIKGVIEREKDCPLVIALKPMIDQFCIDVTAEDKPGEEPDLTKRADDSNTCGIGTTTLAANFCESTRKSMEREKDCSAVNELKPRIDRFCEDFNANQQPGTSERAPFQGCICMKDRYDRMMSIIARGGSAASSRGVGYYRQSIICKRSHDRFERTVIERDGDGSSFDTSKLPPPPIYDKNMVFQRRK